jgi:hypothetical protein
MRQVKITTTWREYDGIIQLLEEEQVAKARGDH